MDPKLKELREFLKRKDQTSDVINMKTEMKYAIEQFRTVYKKASKGIERIYTRAILSNDPEVIKRTYIRFFGYLTKSKNAKEKWKEIEE